MKTLSILILLLLSLQLPAQTWVRGEVRSANGEILAGANVLLEGTYLGATTDTAGRFGFAAEGEGAGQLRSVYMGYADGKAEISFANDTVDVTFQLEEAFNELKAVAITAGAFEAGDASKSATLTSLDMVTTAGSSGDVYGALQTLPGTATVGESGRLFVRGGTGEESQTYIDGQMVQVPYNSAAPGVPTRGRFSPFMFQGTIFSTGGYSAEYGEALSSVLLLNTHDVPTKDRLDIGLLTVGAQLAGTKTWETGSISLDGSYTDLTPYFGIVPQNLSWNRAPHSGNAALSIRQQTGRDGLFKFYAGGSWAGADLAVADPGAASGQSGYDLQNDNLYLNASYKTLIGDQWSLQTGVSATANPERVGLDGATYERSMEGWHGKVMVKRALGEKAKLRVGGEVFGEQQGDRYSEENWTVERQFGQAMPAAFAEVDAYASTRLGFRVGGRWSYHSYLQEHRLAPRFSLAWKLGDHSSVSLAGGRFYQQPRAEYRLATEALRSERADQIVLNHQIRRQNRTLRTEIYYKNYGDLVRFSGTPQQPTNLSNTGDGYAYGLDLFFRDQKTIPNGDYWISYSYLQTERNFQDFPEAAVPTFASTHNFNVVYKHWISDWRSSTGATFTYGSPRRYDDPNTPAFNDGRTASYLSFDLNWSFLYRENIIFHAAVNNVPGFRQEFGYRFADQPNSDGAYESVAIRPPARRFFLIGCFITLSSDPADNQLDTL